MHLPCLVFLYHRALGANRFDVLLMVLGYGIKMTLIGVVIGIAAALGLTRLMASLLFGVRDRCTDVFLRRGVARSRGRGSLLHSHTPGDARRSDGRFEKRIEVRVCDRSLAVHASPAAAVVVPSGAGGPGIGR